MIRPRDHPDFFQLKTSDKSRRFLINWAALKPSDAISISVGQLCPATAAAGKSTEHAGDILFLRDETKTRS